MQPWIRVGVELFARPFLPSLSRPAPTGRVWEPNYRLHRAQYSSFPPEGVTGTSGYRFEYNLHLIKIPSHINREITYTSLSHHNLNVKPCVNTTHSHKIYSRPTPT